MRELVKRDFQARYAGSVFGFLWSFAQPLWQLLLYSFVFSTVLTVTPRGERTDSFAIFLFCGLLPWSAIHEGVVRATTAVTENANLVKKLSFPTETLVLAVVLAALVQQGIATAVFLVVLGASGSLSWQGLPLLAAAVPLQLALTLGLGLLLATLHVFVRDTAQALNVALAAWFYLTPIVYPLAYVPERFRPWIEANPLTALVGLYRRAFLGGAGGTRGVVWLAAVAGVLLLAGWWAFRRLRASFADEI